MIRGLLALTLCGLSLASVTEFTWNDCDSSDPNRAIKISTVKVSPMPIVIPGPVTFGFDANLTKAIQGGKVELEMKRHVFILGDVHIPCLLGVGSCSYDVCTQLQTMANSNDANSRKLSSDIKTILSSNNINVDCPVQPQSASVAAATIQIPDLGTLADVLAAGDYTIKATIKDKSGAVQGCVSFKVELKKKATGFLFG